MAVIEFARNVLHMEGADSTEMAAKTQYPVIDLMDSQLNVTEKGGTMRLGAYKCELTEGSKAYEAYGQKKKYRRDTATGMSSTANTGRILKKQV